MEGRRVYVGRYSTTMSSKVVGTVQTYFTGQVRALQYERQFTKTTYSHSCSTAPIPHAERLSDFQYQIHHQYTDEDGIFLVTHW